MAVNRHLLSQMAKKACRDNFLVFCKLELGMDVAPHHHEWWEALKTGDDVCALAPRDHGKSMSMGRAYPLWKVKYDKWVREVYVLGADQSGSIENLDKIKQMLKDCPSLAPLLPRTRQDLDNRTEMKLSNGKILRAKSFGSRLRGRHPQLIILDDVLNEHNSLTEELREKLNTYFYSVVVPMKDRGQQSQREEGYKPQIVVIGTPQHKMDLYHELLDSEDFIGIHQSAILDEEKELTLWPERYDFHYLMRLKAKIGALNFSREYLCQPIIDETTIFPPSLFKPLFDKHISYEPVYKGHNPVFLGADFSVPGNTDGDYTVLFAMEYDPDASMYTPLGYWRARPKTIDEQLQKIEFFMQAYKVTLGYLEANLFQRIYSEHFAQKGNYPIEGHVVSSSGKNSYTTGLVSIRPLLEQGKMRFPYKTDKDRLMTQQLMEEFNGIVQRKGKITSESAHDDIPMAVWHCYSASRAYTDFESDWS